MKPHQLWASTLLVGVAALSGCVNPGALPKPVQPLDAARLGLAPSTSAPDSQAATSQSLSETAWWRAWGDSRLDALVERALADHPSLQVAQARRLRASASADLERTTDQPQVGLNADVTRQHYTANGMVPPPVAGTDRTSADVRLAASWEFDFFGRHASALAAALGQERAAAADTAAARHWLAVEVVRNHVELARLLAQRRVAQRSLAQREDIVALVRQRVDAGLDTQVELQQSLASVPEVRGQIAALDEQISLARHRLASLSAQPIDALRDYAPELPAAAPPLPAQLNADLLGRRADLVAARWRVEAASQEVTLARQQFYPNLSLNAFAGLSALGLDKLIDTGSRTYGVGPALHLPIFQGDSLRARLRGRAAEYDAAVAAWNSALLDAVREAADAQTSLVSIDVQQQAQSAAHSHAQLAYTHAEQRDQLGLGGRLPVLAAETQLLAQQRAAIDLQARQLDARARLVRALGGGWSTDDESTRRPVRAAAQGAATGSLQ
jgi:NodT family efflux transporter outer membrane factor (OMF) lipoprotein